MGGLLIYVAVLTYILLDPPDTVSIQQFMQDESYGRMPFKDAKDPFTCGISGRTFNYEQQVERSDALARALSQELGWTVNGGTEWDKVMGVFALNTVRPISPGPQTDLILTLRFQVDYMTLAYAVHRLNGILTPANAAYSAPEVEYQLKSAGAKALFTCIPLLETSLQAAKAVGIPNRHVYILEMPKQMTGGKSVPFRSVDDLIVKGRKLKKLEPLKWTKGQGARQTAFLCYSSGTSGLPVCITPL
jgi:acyl-CoA synthetase (AMP-forming)/AMP-acid ligase II